MNQVRGSGSYDDGSSGGGAQGSSGCMEAGDVYPTPVAEAVLDAEFFDLLAELPQGPRKFNRHNLETPTCVCMKHRVAAVFTWAALWQQKVVGLENAGVGLVVSVLGWRQKHPVTSKGIRYFLFDADRFKDRTQWCELVETIMEELDAGRSVLIHCMAGVHRALMCAADTLAVLQGVSFEDAYGCYVLAPARYEDPRAVAQQVTRSGMNAIVRVIEEVKVAMHGWGGKVRAQKLRRCRRQLKCVDTA